MKTFSELVELYGGPNKLPENSICRMDEDDLDVIVEDYVRDLCKRFRHRARPTNREDDEVIAKCGDPKHPTLSEIYEAVGCTFCVLKKSRRRVLKSLKRLALRGRVRRSHYEPSRWCCSNIIEAIAAI